MKLTLLRAFLGLGAATWGAAAPGVFLNWQTAADAMEGFGAGPVTYDRMLDYWLRMASGAFALVGCLYLLLTTWSAAWATPIMTLPRNHWFSRVLL